MEPFVYILLLVGAALLVAYALRRRAAAERTRYRLYETSLGPVGTRRPSEAGMPDGRLARWLALAGIRREGAVSRFWLSTAFGALLGLTAAIALSYSDVLPALRTNLEEIPGRVGYLFVPIIELIPVLLVLLPAAWPTVRVRRARRERVRQILSDLYPVLELFASLAQAGMSFDAALARVLTTIRTDRPLGRELSTFQSEVLGGAERTQSFRRLARRIEVPQVSSFTSALIRAHDVGMGLASTLRRQADDLRSGLRERALARAQSLPARLVFPLVFCFLPGIFVMSLGPAFYGFLVGTEGFGTPR